MKDHIDREVEGLSASPTLPNLSASKLRHQVVDVLEAKIMDGSFAPGMRIPTEVELGEQLGVSRTVIRDAIRALEVRGLVDVRRGRGTIVRPLSLDAYAEAVATFIIRSDLTMGDLMDARVVLEGGIIRAAAQNRVDDDIERIGTAFAEFRSAVERGNYDTAAHCHVTFHMALVRAAHLRALSMLLEPIQLMMIATSLVPEDSDRSDAEAWSLETHEGLRDAVTSGDPEAVELAIEAHWGPTRLRYRSIRPRPVSDHYASPRELLRAAGRSEESGHHDEAALGSLKRLARSPEQGDPPASKLDSRE